jgi:hypothetical protein
MTGTHKDTLDLANEKPLIFGSPIPTAFEEPRLNRKFEAMMEDMIPPQKYSGQFDHRDYLLRIANCIGYELTYKPMITESDKKTLNEAKFKSQFVSLIVADLLAKFKDNSPEFHSIKETLEDIFALMNPMMNGVGRFNISMTDVMKYGEHLDELIHFYYVPKFMQLTMWQRLKFQFFGNH